jgi:hypothetical protein
MALSNSLNVSAFPAVAGAAVGQYRAVKLDTTAGRVVVTSAITDLAVGVALVAADAAGDQLSVQTFGVAKCVASGAITLGDQVMPTSSGSGKVVTAAGATAKSLGVALQAAAADGDIIEVLLATPNVNGIANS